MAALHVFQNPLGEAVVAETLEEALKLAKKYRESRGKKTTGPSMKYVRVPDTKTLTVFETYSQRFIPMPAGAWAKRMGKGVPHVEDE